MQSESRSYWQSTVPAIPLSTELPRMIDVAVMEVTYQSQSLLRQVLQEEAIACDYREPGTIRLALTQEQGEQLTQEVEARQDDGYPAQFLEREHIQTFIKTPLAPEILGGRYLPDQGLLHSARLVQGLAHAALRRGAYAYQAEVYGLLPEKNLVRIQTSRGVLLARTAIVAVNAWASKLLPMLTDIIVPVREQMLAYAPVKPVFITGISAMVTTDEYWQQTPDGVILIGGCGSVAPNEDIGIWESVPTAIVQEAIERVLPHLFPSFAPPQVIRRWAGLLDYTTDSHPIVDRVPQMPNVLFVAGFSGHGMPFGMRFGQLLATAAHSGALPLALKPFRLDRPTLKKWSSVHAVPDV